MKTKKLVTAVATALAASTIAGPASAGVKFKDGDKYLKIGGRIQLQYHSVDPDSGSSTDELFFRRLRPYIEGSVLPGWKGKFQWDMGKATGSNEISVKDAYLQYKGFDGMKVSVGNVLFPFSREQLTSSKRQQLVERTFVGDHNYGTPDRELGAYLHGHNGDKTITWAAGIANAGLDPDSDKLDFGSLANRNSDFNEGWMYGGRVDFHPLGYLKMAQGDFTREQRLTVGVAVFGWSNDDDNNTRTTGSTDTSGGGKPDVDSVTGYELSAGYRNAGFSIDAQYNGFEAQTIDPTVTAGIYSMGETTLENWAVEGGYMIVPEKFEVVAGYSSQDADGYATEWTRTELGLNWFLHKHKAKVQLTFRSNSDKDGVNGSDEDEVFLQTQYVF